jgi:hypothetical protein
VTESAVVVVNCYRWIGNPAAAGFVVYLDGRRIGVAPVSGALTVQVGAGRHVVRVRLWYFLSSKLAVEAGPGQTVRLFADRPRGKRLFRQFRGLVDPFHWLWLEQAESP